ncbi:GNAT family N-acetyltransferase [Crocinitomicaceae bacterium CZZ-1]|uniref:GNAT family N-acetyltransferase n=1 Tax=Taishania pollutisoli TaxID=2766479 RepID=A0A8J6P7Z7_9FLAO|nr:GNAT family N-acetyltransferase [Taishania pollutisoli]MBC9813457.1 GNAT family N-acetyltransferase [Taishania pollutisoli]MBX2950656.1 GNAT family N-acetyltransferase [Crocinitomicaceae bacterium]NGF76503.1 GNAT family N-acetyltransferase [Fluviicola sp. SGL-29]
MNWIIETERLYLREIDVQDVDDLFEMDADPQVHLYIENNPVQTKEQIVEVIQMLQRQYAENGIARWAVVDKQTGECVGWSGLKLFRTPLNGHVDFYELGYRFKTKHWGKGYATETSRAIIDYGFDRLNVTSLYAITHPENEKSIHVLNKLGFQFIETFDYEGDVTNWFEIRRK